MREMRILGKQECSSPRRSGNQSAELLTHPLPATGPPCGPPGVRVIRAVTARYIRHWLAGWLLFRCHAQGFGGRALVPGDRPTGAGRFRIAGGRCGVLAGLSGGGGTGSGGSPKKIRMKRKGGARITRIGQGCWEEPRATPINGCRSERHGHGSRFARCCLAWRRISQARASACWSWAICRSVLRRKCPSVWE